MRKLIVGNSIQSYADGQGISVVIMHVSEDKKGYWRTRWVGLEVKGTRGNVEEDYVIN